MKKHLGSLVLILILFGCSIETEEKIIQIRVANDSAFDYSNIILNNGFGDRFYGDLPAGEVSDYQYVPDAYLRPFVEFQAEGRTFTRQPFDYTGDSTIREGKYTYHYYIGYTSRNEMQLYFYLKREDDNPLSSRNFNGQ